MAKESITIAEAVKKLHQWMEAKDYDKVVQGCQEILQIDPKNKEAQDLLKKAQNLKSEIASSPTEQKSEPFSPEKTSGTASMKFPEAQKEEEMVIFPGEKASPVSQKIRPEPQKDTPVKFPKSTPLEEEDTLNHPTEPDKHHENGTKHFLVYLVRKIIIIIFIFAAIGGLVYGGFIGYKYYTDSVSENDEEATNPSEETEPIETSTEENNDEITEKVIEEAPAEEIIDTEISDISTEEPQEEQSKKQKVKRQK